MQKWNHNFNHHQHPTQNNLHTITTTSAATILSGEGRSRRSTTYLIIFIFVFSFIIAALHLAKDSKLQIEQRQSSHDEEDLFKHRVSDGLMEMKCNWFEGQWVFDDEFVPMYDGKTCKYVKDQLACEKYGRKDLSYQKWRWQPRRCNLPRFNATSILEKLRNKRLVYVGDSLNRGQWVSMVCLVEHIIPSHLKSMTFHGSLASFKAIEYNATIENYWAPMLVESNSDDPDLHRSPERVVRVESIENHARHWTNADVLIFDSYIWWLCDKMKVLWGSFESYDAITTEVDMPKAYEMGLRTWAEWLEVHIDRSKTQMYFNSLSPTHYSAEDWGGAKGQNCYNETVPIQNESYWGRNSVVTLMRIAERTVNDLRIKGLNIQILNITQLSEYRKDGHPTIHKKQWRSPTKEQVANPASYADCAHWCLPGVPDTWNEILHTYIVRS